MAIVGRQRKAGQAAPPPCPGAPLLTSEPSSNPGDLAPPLPPISRFAYIRVIVLCFHVMKVTRNMTCNRDQERSTENLRYARAFRNLGKAVLDAASNCNGCSCIKKKWTNNRRTDQVL